MGGEEPDVIMRTFIPSMVDFNLKFIHMLSLDHSVAFGSGIFVK